MIPNISREQYQALLREQSQRTSRVKKALPAAIGFFISAIATVVYFTNDDNYENKLDDLISNRAFDIVFLLLPFIVGASVTGCCMSSCCTCCKNSQQENAMNPTYGAAENDNTTSALKEVLVEPLPGAKSPPATSPVPKSPESSEGSPTEIKKAGMVTTSKMTDAEKMKLAASSSIKTTGTDCLSPTHLGRSVATAKKGSGHNSAASTPKSGASSPKDFGNNFARAGSPIASRTVVSTNPSASSPSAKGRGHQPALRQS